MFIDMHCDTLMKLAGRSIQGDLRSCPDVAVDFKRLIESKAMIQFFAIFMLSERTFRKYDIPLMDDRTYICDRVAYLKKYVDQESDHIVLVDELSKLEQVGGTDKVGVLLTVEDGRYIENELARVEFLYGLGIRLVGLLWNEENSLGFPNSRDGAVNSKGLKPMGIETVREMNRLGMVVDTSHLNDAGFYDVAKYSTKPFVASHSNCRALADHPRNMTDDMLRVLADKGGVAGLNYMPEFLRVGSSVSAVEDMVLHAKHMKQVAGIDSIALGSDLDGIHGDLEISACDGHGKLFEALSQAGFSDEEVEKIAFKNVRRLLKDVL